MSTSAERRKVREGLLALGFKRNHATNDHGKGAYAESWRTAGGDLAVISWVERTDDDALAEHQQYIADLDGYVKYPHPETLSPAEAMQAMLALAEEAQPVDPAATYPATPEEAKVCPHLVRYWRGHECGECEGGS